MNRFDRELEKNFSKVKVSVACPKCGKKLQKTVGELRRGVKCPGCGVTVQS